MNPGFKTRRSSATERALLKEMSAGRGGAARARGTRQASGGTLHEVASPSSRAGSDFWFGRSVGLGSRRVACVGGLRVMHCCGHMDCLCLPRACRMGAQNCAARSSEAGKSIGWITLRGKGTMNRGDGRVWARYRVGKMLGRGKV